MAIRPKSENISVVIHGPVRTDTKETFKSVRRLLPNSEIIFSTWENQNTNNLPYDLLIKNKQPASYVQHKRLPVKNNLNCIIRSAKAGIQQVKRKFILRIRSDLILTSLSFITNWELYPSLSDYTVFKHKIIVPLLFSRISYHGKLTPFHLSDWASFGLSEDIKLLFEFIEEVRDPEFTTWFSNRKSSPFGSTTYRMSPEQYLHYSIFKQFRPEVAFDDCSYNTKFIQDQSNKFIVSNFIILDKYRSGFELRKYSEEVHSLGDQYLELWNRFNYEQMYQTYCDRYFNISQDVLNFQQECVSNHLKLRLLKHKSKLKNDLSFRKAIEECFSISYIAILVLLDKLNLINNLSKN